MWPFSKKEIINSKKRYIDYLPVGTIIKLYNDPEEYMIFRYLGNACIPFKSNSKFLKKSKLYSTAKEDKNKYYRVDYTIAPYPTGLTFDIGEFNIMQEDIEEIIHLGYDDTFRRDVLMDIDSYNEVGEKIE